MPVYPYNHLPQYLTEKNGPLLKKFSCQEKHELELFSVKGLGLQLMC